jgi:hypothetical protein
MMTSSKWTRHGHWFGDPAGPTGADMAARPAAIARCGGPGMCTPCALDAGHTLRDVTAVLAARHPEVGDHVLYRSYGTPGGEFPPCDRAAIVSEADGLWAGLVVLNPSGLFFRSLADGGAHYDQSGLKGGTWHWKDAG